MLILLGVVFLGWAVFTGHEDSQKEIPSIVAPAPELEAEPERLVPRPPRQTPKPEPAPQPAVASGDQWTREWEGPAPIDPGLKVVERAIRDNTYVLTQVLEALNRRDNQ